MCVGVLTAFCWTAYPLGTPSSKPNNFRDLAQIFWDDLAGRRQVRDDDGDDDGRMRSVSMELGSCIERNQKVSPLSGVQTNCITLVTLLPKKGEKCVILEPSLP